MSSIYDHPETYNLEHSGPEPDIEFFQGMLSHSKPKRILEYACGNGRLTIPLAKEASKWNGTVIGIDCSESMLTAASQESNPGNIEWLVGDVRYWKPKTKVDLIISACGSLSHLLTLEDQISVWKNARDSLSPLGRFVVAEVAPDYQTMADSLQSPARRVLQFDGDFEDDKDRLIRCRVATYRADLQRMRVRYLYDKFSHHDDADRFAHDYDAHIYFPNEIRLLFKIAGFELQQVWGDYRGNEFSHHSRSMIFSGIVAGANQ